MQHTHKHAQTHTNTHTYTHTTAAEKRTKELEVELARTKKAADDAKKKAEEEAKKKEEEAEARAKEKAAADAKKVWCKLQFDAGNVLSVYGATFTIGRLQSNNLIFEDACLSGTHCCLAPPRESDKPPILTDTSTNGTFVAGEKLHKSSRQLQWGDRVEVVLGNKNLCFVVSNHQEKSESSRATGNRQEATVQKATMQAQRGGGDVLEILKDLSTVDMWSDRHPPTTVCPRAWTAVRDQLHKKGESLRGAVTVEKGQSPSGSVGDLVYRAASSLNSMQHYYKQNLLVVGGEGRLLVERALGVLIHPNDLKGAHTPPDKKGKKRPITKDSNMNDKIILMATKNLVSQEVVLACHKLREYGNRTDHDSLPDLKPEEKPDVIKNAFIVAQALLTKVDQIPGVC
jgi:pSer/pThr/pTyr-binding forkhead associated (FHA) protein